MNLIYATQNHSYKNVVFKVKILICIHYSVQQGYTKFQTPIHLGDCILYSDVQYFQQDYCTFFP